VTDAPEQHQSALSSAAFELARLREQTTQARAGLKEVLRDIAEAQSQLGQAQAAQLLEANEQLVLAIVRAKTEAETAAMALDAASRSSDFDALTSLPNRVLLLDRFAQAIANAKRRAGRVALMFMDLDGFKQINDTLGHAVGDQVLQLVAVRLQSSVRAADTVSRHGGDEFLILLPEVSDASGAATIAEKVLGALRMPSRVDDHVLRLNASIGISLYPDDGHSVEALIDNADAAMYRVKRGGLGGFAVFGDGVDTLSGVHSVEPAAHSVQHRTLSAHDLAEHERRIGQLREANEHLVLAALSALDLQTAAEAARRRQTDLLAMVAHELRNPLNPIRTAAALLGRAGPHDLPRLQAIIERQVLRVSRLASDLLDVARISTGKLRLNMQLLDLVGVIEHAVDACRPSMDLRQQCLSLHLPAQHIGLHADSDRLVQVFSNLLDNASKYTPNGGEIGLSVKILGDSVEITVSDNGIGMTTQAMSDLFDPFVQEVHAVSFNGLGLGLGLTVVRELVEVHGGKVVASSAGAGMGSRFVVTLPLAAAGAL